MLKCSTVQKFKYSDVQMFKCSKVQMFKFSNVQMFKCWKFQMSKVKCQMSIRLNFCQSLPPEFLYVQGARTMDWTKLYAIENDDYVDYLKWNYQCPKCDVFFSRILPYKCSLTISVTQTKGQNKRPEEGRSIFGIDAELPI